MSNLRGAHVLAALAVVITSLSVAPASASVVLNWTATLGQPGQMCRGSHLPKPACESSLSCIEGHCGRTQLYAMSYNIAGGARSHANTRAAMDGMARNVCDEQPEVIGLQEDFVSDAQFWRFRDALENVCPGVYASAVHYVDPRTSIDVLPTQKQSSEMKVVDGKVKAINGILYDRSRFELADSLLWRLEFETCHQRSVRWAQLRDRRTGEVFDVFNTHLNHCSDADENRANHAVEITNLAEFGVSSGPTPPGLDGNVVVLGDMNSGRTGSATMAFLNYGLQRSQSLEQTTPGGATIDWVFHSPEGRTLRSVVLNDELEASPRCTNQSKEKFYTCSDHYPIGAEMLFW